jgi:hypothetical protein
MTVEHYQKEGENSSRNVLEIEGREGVKTYKKYKKRTCAKVIEPGIIKKKRLVIRKIKGAKMFRRWLDVCGDRKKELIYKARLILRFKKRIRALYEKHFAVLDTYFRKRARFIYKEKKSGEFTGKLLYLNFYQHREKQNDIKVRAAFNNLEKKFVEEVFTGKNTIQTDPWYLYELNLLNEIDRESMLKGKIFDCILEELDKLGAFKDIPYNDVFSDSRGMDLVHYSIN